MLRRENRLAKIAHQGDGKKYLYPLFNVRIFDNKENKVRFGFVVSKRIDKRAVVRNRTKRVLRQAAKEVLRDLVGKDIVVIAKKSLSFKDKKIVSQEFAGISKK
jgi:ribonuclease P protein component